MSNISVFGGSIIPCQFYKITAASGAIYGLTSVERAIPYDPMPAETAAACEQIRAGWSESERRKRLAWAECEP